MTKTFFYGFLILSLLILARPSSAHDPLFVNVGDGDANCLAYGSPYIGFADCQTTLTGGYGTLAVTQLPGDFDTPVQWNYDQAPPIINHSITSESSEFAGTPGTCPSGESFDSGTNFYPEFSWVFLHLGTCYYYCKTHGPSLMRGV